MTAGWSSTLPSERLGRPRLPQVSIRRPHTVARRCRSVDDQHLGCGLVHVADSPHSASGPVTSSEVRSAVDLDHAHDRVPTAAGAAQFDHADQATVSKSTADVTVLPICASTRPSAPRLATVGASPWTSKKSPSCRHGERDLGCRRGRPPGGSRRPRSPPNPVRSSGVAGVGVAGSVRHRRRGQGQAEDGRAKNTERKKTDMGPPMG